jgi:hypothetical protein
MSDIANKGEAERCRDIAKGFLAQCQYEKAIRFYEKSLRLYALPGVEESIKAAQKLATESTGSTKPQSNSETSSKSSSGSSSSNRGGGASSASNPGPGVSRSASSSSEPGTRPYSDEQEACAKKLLANFKKSHYEALCLKKNATDSEIKKAYRKLALQLHPDKNSAPSAENAFKALNAAYDCLSDERKRQVYDAYGAEASEQMAHDQDNGRGDAGSGFGFHRRGHGHGDISPEDIFNMFFQGGMSGGPRVFFNRRGGFHRQEQRQPQDEARTQTTANPFQQLFQLLPILLLIVMSLSNLGGSSSASPFSLYQHGSYQFERKTKAVNVIPGIPYFVSKDFEGTMGPKDKLRVEKAVESSYAESKAQQCVYDTEKKVRRINHVIFV